MHSMAFRLVKKFFCIKENHYDIIGVQWREQPTQHDDTQNDEKKNLFNLPAKLLFKLKHWIGMIQPILLFRIYMYIMDESNDVNHVKWLWIFFWRMW